MPDISEIERRIDHAVAGATPVGADIGGIAISNMAEVFELAKMMSVAGAAVPSHCRGNPGICLAICIQALEWKMSPFAVANKSYVVNNRGSERLSFESQLIHAIIEARAPLVGRLRYEILGEGDERRCRVWGLFRGETEPHSYTSETLGTLRGAKGRNSDGNVKGSPLWDTQPEIQLFYSTSRAWARLFAPDVLLGLYTPEELTDESGPERARDVTPARSSIADRLPGQGQARGGFSAAHVERETAAAVGGNGGAGAAPAGGQVIEGDAAKRGRGRPRRNEPAQIPAGTDAPINTMPPADGGGQGEPLTVDLVANSDAGGDAGEVTETRAVEPTSVAADPSPQPTAPGASTPVAEEPAGGATDSRPAPLEPEAAAPAPLLAAAPEAAPVPEPDTGAGVRPAEASAPAYANGMWGGTPISDLGSATLARALASALAGTKSHFDFRDVWADFVDAVSSSPKPLRVLMQRIYDRQHERVFSKADPATVAADCARLAAEVATMLGEA
jgi:hypothetical protein